MHFRQSLLFALLFGGLSASGVAQEILSVDANTINQHLDHRVDPIYPPIAMAVRLQGTVAFHVKIGTTGKIESMKVVSGPAMLQQAALDSLKEWTYHPLLKDGKSVTAEGPVSIEFSLGTDAPTTGELDAAARFFPIYMECRAEISAGKDYSEASSTCKKAAGIANEFPADQRFNEKRDAFVTAATAFLYSGDMKSALIYSEKAVDIVKLGHADNSGSNAAYGIKGFVEGKIGDLSAADQDLTVAEDFERKGILWAEKEVSNMGFSKEYKRTLIQDLRFHAQVLNGLNRTDDAQKKLDEAAKLN